jgi:Flp pilus assembly protein TadD
MAMPAGSIIAGSLTMSRCEDERRRASRRPLILPILIFVLVLGVFLPALHNDFVNYDDPDYVTSNPRVQQGLTLEDIRWAFQTNHAANWHPVTWLSHMLDCSLYGQNPTGHHFTSIFFHALSTALLFLLFWRATGATGRSFVLAALFGLHPLRVESVAWVCERKDVLATFFGLLTLWFYALRNSAGLAGQVSRRFYYAAALICFALGLMCKSMLVTLPFVMLLIDYWPLRRYVIPSEGTACPPWREESRGKSVKVAHRDPSTSLRMTGCWIPLLAEKLPFFAIAGVASAVTLLVQARAGAVKAIAFYPVAARTGNALVSYARYLGKFFLPVNLAVFYPHPVYWPVWSILTALVLLVAISVAAVRLRHRFPWFLIGWLWFVGTAVPIIGLIQVGAQSMADRYTYIPSIGLALIAIWGVSCLTNQKSVLVGMSVVTLGACAFMTQRQIGFWRDSVTLFRHTIAVTGKNPVAHMNLGVALLDGHQSSEGLGELRRAVELAPHYGEAHLTLGTAFEKTGDYQSAIDELDEAIRLDPRASKPYFEGGVVFEKMGHRRQAIELFRKAIEREPTPAAHSNLGVALEQTGQFDAAIGEYLLALHLDSSYSNAAQNLGALYFKLNRPEDARRQFERAVKLEPESAVAHNNLAGALFALGKVNDAIAEYQRALQLKPDYTEARINLAGALKNKQQ